MNDKFLDFKDMMKPQKRIKGHRDFTAELAAMLPPERVKRARKETQKVILRIRLVDLMKRIFLPR